MSRTWWALPLLLGCAQGEIDTADSGEEAVTQLMELGQIEGVVRRTAELQGDGVGNVIVLAFYAQQPSTDRFPHNVLVVPYQDLSRPDAEVAYSLTNFFPEPEPYYVLAVFDEDDSLMESFSWVPTAGDLLSDPLGVGAFEPIYIESGDVREVNLELTVVVDEAR